MSWAHVTLNQLKETEREARWSLSQTWVAPAARLTHPVGHPKYISQHPSWQAQIYQTVGRTFQASQLKVRTGQGISVTPASSIPHTSLLACQPRWPLQCIAGSFHRGIAQEFVLSLLSHFLEVRCGIGHFSQGAQEPPWNWPRGP